MKIDEISIMGHSSGATLSLLYGILFPENIKMIVDLDGRKPSPEPQEISVEFLKFMKKFYQAEYRNQKKFEKTFALEELSQRYAAATGGSVTKEVAPYILNRSLTKCEKSGNFYFTHDNRFTLQTITGLQIFQKFPEEMARKIKCPLMVIECLKNPIFGLGTFHGEALDVLKENENFEHYAIDETHHVHLTEPEKISGIISDFILKHN